MYIFKNCNSFNVRNRKCIFEKFSLSVSERSPEVFCKRIFNKLPEEIRKIKSVNSFKRNLHVYLLNKTYYSVDEFLR